MKIRYFLRSWILKTSTLIIFSTLVTMLIMFLIIGSSLYRHLSAYILEQSTKYTDSIAEQVQQRLNSTLSEIDSNIQQLCNDIQIQNIQIVFIYMLLYQTYGMVIHPEKQNQNRNTGYKSGKQHLHFQRAPKNT